MLFKDLKLIYGFPDGKTVVSYNINGREAIVGGANGSGIKIYETDVDDQEYISTDINEHLDSITCVAVSKNGAFATGGADGIVILYKSNNSVDKILVRSTVSIRDLSFHPNGTKIAIATDENIIRVVLTTDNSKIVQIEGHTCPVKSIDYHPSGNYLLSSDIEGNIRIWDVSPNTPLPKCIKVLPKFCYSSEIDSILTSTVSWNPDQSCFAFPGTKNDIRVFRSDIWTPFYSLDQHHTANVITFAWSPNGYYIASAAEDNSFAILDTKTKKVVVSEVTSAQITGIAWNPTGNELTLTDVHGQVRVWKEVIPTDNSNYPHPAVLRTKPTNSSQQILRKELQRPTNPNPMIETESTDRDEEDEDIDMLEDLGEDVVDELFGDDVGDFVIDDDGAGYADTTTQEKPIQVQSKLNLNQNLSAVTKFQRQFDAAFDPPTTFQPGETPYHKPESGKSFEPAPGERRYMAYNLVGVITTIFEDDHSVINVEFHDQSEYRNFHFTDALNFSMGAISTAGTVFAVEGKQSTVKPRKSDLDGLTDDEDQPEPVQTPSTLYFRPNKMGSNSKDWTHHMLPGEDVVSVAVNRISVIATTSLGYVRVFSTSGVQRHVFSLENVVSITAMTDLAFIVYSTGPSFQNQQNLDYLLFNTDTNEILQKDKIQLTTDSQLNWIGFSETNQAVTYDSAGILRVLQRQRRPFQASWVPVLDGRRYAASLERTEKYWPVGVLRDRLMCVILRGSHTYPFFPRPPVKDIMLQMPLLDMSNEVGQLEEQVLRISTTNLHEHDEAEATQTEEDYAEIFDEADIEMDKALLKLINLACKAEKLARAIDLTYILHTEESIDKAIKIASFHRFSGLAEKMMTIKEEKFVNGAPSQPSTLADALQALPAIYSSSESGLDSDLSFVGRETHKRIVRVDDDDDDYLLDSQLNKRSKPFRFTS